jgi:FeS assembly protein IscX
MEADLSESLNWEASYAVAKRLQARHPAVRLEDVSLEMLLNWVLEIPEFDDDPELANDEVLLDIYQVWLEESLEAESPLHSPAD